MMMDELAKASYELSSRVLESLAFSSVARMATHAENLEN